MKAAVLTVLTVATLALCGTWAGALAEETEAEKTSSLHLPWQEAGLTERQAAAHLLNRFAFGPRPGEVEAVVKMGLGSWFERQLAGTLPDGQVEEDLRRLPALRMSTREIARTYPPPGLVLLQAREAGVLPEELDGMDRKDLKDLKEGDRAALRDKVMEFARKQGYRSQKELLGQLMTQKLLRAVGSENQLSEVMADFWFNHFNVSLTDHRARAYLLSYERDAIRPHALGRFRNLLEATAKSPAMLLYLDNARSSATAESPTTMEGEIGRMPRQRARLQGGRRGFGARGFGGGGRAGSVSKGNPGMGSPGERGDPLGAESSPERRQRPRGLNENYARELMELHTLGVDGGYAQKDVVEVARAFTGWSVLPAGRLRERAEQRLVRVKRAGGLGFHSEGEFLFRADQHDAGEKIVLGVRFPAGRGIEDGEAVLDLLAAHRAAARHISTKLAVRFVSDNPPQSLVDRLTAVYIETGGDVRRLLTTIAESAEFWSRDAVGAKVKSPFELAASALRATGGEIADPRETLKWIARMGQPLYAYQAPTGYPDRGEAWVNTGSLLSRMNFGLQLAADRVSGVEVDLPALNGGRGLESREEALRVYAGLLMPGRDLASTLKLLGPMVADPNLPIKVDQAAPQDSGKGAKGSDPDEEMVYGDPERGTTMRSIKIRDRLGDASPEPTDRRPPTPLEQVVGVILGSPEFQRR